MLSLFLRSLTCAIWKHTRENQKINAKPYIERNTDSISSYNCHSSSVLNQSNSLLKWPKETRCEISNVFNRCALGMRGGGPHTLQKTLSSPLENYSYLSQPSVLPRPCSDNTEKRLRRNKSKVPTLWSGRRCSTSTLRSTWPRHRWPWSVGMVLKTCDRQKQL